MNKLFNSLEGDKQIALEMIEFQNDSFAKDIEVLFSGLITELGKNPAGFRTINMHENVKDIEELTFKRIGIKVGLVLNGLTGSVLPFYPNEYTVLLDKSMHGKLYGHDAFSKMSYAEQYKIIEQALDIKGSVDVKHCKVSGIFSEYKNPIHINLMICMRYGLTAGEITAVYLHELGHAFHSFEYSNRMNRTNQVLAELLRNTTSRNNLSKDYIFRELKVLNPKTTNEELDKIFSGENIVLSKATFQYLKEMIESQLPGDRYNENVFETLADNFTARWGYAEKLITGLDKFEDKSIFNPRQNMTGAVLASLSSVILIIVACYLYLNFVVSTVALLAAGTHTASAIASFWGGVAGIVTYFIGTVLASFIFWHSSYDDKMTYDDLKFRYKRIRNQLVELLKDLDLPAVQTKDTIAQIKLCDEIIASTNGYKNVVSYFLDFFTPGHRSSQDDIAIQRLLEELSANDLYIKAASLRTA